MEFNSFIFSCYSTLQKHSSSQKIRYVCRQLFYQYQIIQSSEGDEHWGVWDGRSGKRFSCSTAKNSCGRYQTNELGENGTDDNCHGTRSGRNSGGANVLLDCLARWTRRSTRRKETENPTWASIRLWRTELVPIQPLIQFPPSP